VGVAAVRRGDVVRAEPQAGQRHDEGGGGDPADVLYVGGADRDRIAPVPEGDGPGGEAEGGLSLGGDGGGERHQPGRPVEVNAGYQGGGVGLDAHQLHRLDGTAIIDGDAELHSVDEERSAVASLGEATTDGIGALDDREHIDVGDRDEGAQRDDQV